MKKTTCKIYRIILKGISNKQDGRARTGFISFRIKNSGRLL
jgi:hypothetical protein